MGDQILHDRDEAWIGDGRLLPTKHLKRGSRLEMRDRHIGPALVQNHHHRQDPGDVEDGKRRSEEHTSELQSLMRISYAVFCLKNKTQTRRRHVVTTTTI